MIRNYPDALIRFEHLLKFEFIIIMLNKITTISYVTFRYKENMNRLSAIHRDRPMSPLDTAIYWTEYVIRHKGAYHLRSAAVNLSWYQYLLLDVLAFVVIVTIVTLYIFYRLIKFLIIKLVFTSKNVNCCRHGETKSPRNENDWLTNTRTKFLVPFAAISIFIFVTRVST